MGGDTALVENARSRAIALKTHLAGHEVGIGDTEGGSCKTSRRHGAVFAKNQPIGVDQHDLPIGRQLAKDLRGRLADDSV